MEHVLKNWEGFILLGGSAVLGVVIHFILFKTVEVSVRRARTVLGESIVNTLVESY